ncbi:MAG: hypothetical protein AAGK04_13530 [Planctomycetota bacterium]
MALASAGDLIAGDRPDGDDVPEGRLALLLAATLWASLLSIAGAWLWLDAASRWPVAEIPCRVAGLTAGASGQLVFMCLVADRVFPDAPRGLVRAIEAIMGVGVFAGALWIGAVGLELLIGVA